MVNRRQKEAQRTDADDGDVQIRTDGTVVVGNWNETQHNAFSQTERRLANKQADPLTTRFWWQSVTVLRERKLNSERIAVDD